jgi:hypothetical protein
MPFDTDSEEGDLLLGENVDHPDTPGWSFRVDVAAPCAEGGARRCAEESCPHQLSCQAMTPAGLLLVGLPAVGQEIHGDTGFEVDLFAVGGACTFRLSIRTKTQTESAAALRNALENIRTISGGPAKISACHMQ